MLEGKSLKKKYKREDKEKFKIQRSPMRQFSYSFLGLINYPKESKRKYVDVAASNIRPRIKTGVLGEVARKGTRRFTFFSYFNAQLRSFKAQIKFSSSLNLLKAIMGIFKKFMSIKLLISRRKNRTFAVTARLRKKFKKLNSILTNPKKEKLEPMEKMLERGLGVLSFSANKTPNSRQLRRTTAAKHIQS